MVTVRKQNVNKTVTTQKTTSVFPVAREVFPLRFHLTFRSVTQMSISLRKHAAMFLAATFTVGSMATFGAAALDQPTAVLSSTLNHSVGTVLTSAEISNAQQAMAKAKASALKAQQDAAKKAQEEAATKADAAIKAAEEAAKKEAEIKAAATQTAYNQLVASAATARPVAYSTTYLASDAIKANATALGNYKLTFYDPCVECNGNNLALTATGTTLTEGRTIAVDPSVIPLGSRVFIEGYGVFIAEDTGGAIKGNKIDIAVSTHERANELGVQYANVYLLK